MSRPRALLLLLVLVSVSSAGCIRWWGPEDLRRDLSKTAGVKLKKEFGITVTRSGMWLARKVLRMAGETDVPIRGIKRVEVGVYEVQGLRRGRDERTRLTLDDLDLPSWHTMVRVHEDDEDVFVLTYENDEGRMTQMLVVVAEDEEWVLVRMKGNLEQVVEDAMRYAFEEADRPDLYAATREERGLPPLDEVEEEPMPLGCLMAASGDPALVGN